MGEDLDEGKIYGDGGSLERAVNGLNGERNMTRLAVKSTQNNMIEELRGDMGTDMLAVLNGERRVEVGSFQKKKFKIKSWFKRLLRTF